MKTAAANAVKHVKAYSYLRFSTNPQQYGDSERRQLEAADKMANANGWTIDESFRLADRGVSAFHGTNANEGDLAKFLAAVEAGTVKPGEVLIVENLDRLSRQEPMKSFSLFGQIINKGVTLATTQDGQTYTQKTVAENPGQLFIVLGILQRAHEESRTKSKRALSNWQAKRKEAIEKGLPITSNTPTWIDLDKATNTFKFNELADALRLMAHMATTGHGPTAIMRKMEERGLKWSRETTRRYMINRALIGEYQPRNRAGEAVGEPVANYYPALITEEQFYAMQATIHQRRGTIKAGRTGKRIGNLFQGILFDAQGERYVISGVGAKKAIVSHLRKCGTATGLPAFPYAPFEKCFLQWVKEIDITTHAETSVANVIEGKMANVRSKADQLTAAMADADAASFPRMVQMLAKFEAEEAQLAKELEIERAKEHRASYSTADIGHLVEQMESMSEAEQLDIRTRLKIAIAAVVERIILSINVQGSKRLAIANVLLKNKECRTFTIMTERGAVKTYGGAKGPGYSTDFDWSEAWRLTEATA